MTQARGVLTALAVLLGVSIVLQPQSGFFTPFSRMLSAVEPSARTHRLQPGLKHFLRTRLHGERTGYACSSEPYVPKVVGFTGQGSVHGDPEDKHVFERYFSCDGNEPVLRRGTYLELGALDGVQFSNTRFFDKELDWGGLLVEPSSAFFELAENRGSNEHNHIVHSAVCDVEGEIDWMESNTKAVSGIAQTMPDAFKPKFHTTANGEVTSKLRCASLGALLNEAGIKELDLFSLDVEGAELMVLQTMDWSIPVHILIIEMDGNNPEKETKIRELLEQNHMQCLETHVGFGGKNEVWSSLPRAVQGTT